MKKKSLEKVCIKLSHKELNFIILTLKFSSVWTMNEKAIKNINRLINKLEKSKER